MAQHLPKGDQCLTYGALFASLSSSVWSEIRFANVYTVSVMAMQPEKVPMVEGSH